jgi:hypothetical protein
MPNRNTSRTERDKTRRTPGDRDGGRDAQGHGRNAKRTAQGRGGKGGQVVKDRGKNARTVRGPGDRSTPERPSR